VALFPSGGQVTGRPAIPIENSACPDGSYSSSLDSVLDPTGIEYCMPWWVGGWVAGLVGLSLMACTALGLLPASLSAHVPAPVLMPPHPSLRRPPCRPAAAPLATTALAASRLRAVQAASTPTWAWQTV
jgi:hypothetical protein